jgi:hypothetical protein
MTKMGGQIRQTRLKSEGQLFRSEPGLALRLIFTLLAQSGVKLAATDAFPAGYGFLAAHRAACFTCATFSCVHEHVAAKRAIPEFRPHIPIPF